MSAFPKIRVKMIEQTSHFDLESKVNQWLEENIDGHTYVNSIAVIITPPDDKVVAGYLATINYISYPEA